MKNELNQAMAQALATPEGLRLLAAQLEGSPARTRLETVEAIDLTPAFLLRRAAEALEEVDRVT